MKFQEKLEKAIEKNDSLLCVGLDPDIQNLSGEKSQFEFNKKIIDQTATFACCFKPQIAFYAAAGLKGVEDLTRTITYIHNNYPLIPVLLDAKRGDVGHTSEMYAKEAFDFFNADAVTVNPYLGFDSVEPFLNRKDRGVFVLCKTSNPGASDFQGLVIEREPLYIKVAKKSLTWNKKYGNVLLVVGATSPNELMEIRKVVPNMTFLVPGIGAQGGDLKTTLSNGLIKSHSSFSRKRESSKGLIISASRSIIYNSSPRAAAQKLRDEINKYR
ncbi:orotidine-5'-phosphate decarboxylase [Candidatus Curtissbacteria bacterium]|nr:orotidine-5'-phosphate decarboxylase [Candidatus Curtissbacteria bacterium]